MATNNQSRESRCRHCGETRHNIRTCRIYIQFIHEKLIRVYLNQNPIAFPIQLDSFNLISHLTPLARNVGFPIPENLNRNYLQGYLENFHLRYIEVANQYREAMRFRTPPRQRRVMQEPPPIQPRRREYFLAEMNDMEILEVRNHYENRANHYVQLIREINMEMDIRQHEKPTVQMHVDITKFPNAITSCECPICYETCNNMVATTCAHLFCQTCTNTMINRSARSLTCAMCRTPIRDLYVHSEESMNQLYAL